MRELHTIGIRVTASGTLERNQVWAESVFIRRIPGHEVLEGTSEFDAVISINHGQYQSKPQLGFGSPSSVSWVTASTTGNPSGRTHKKTRAAASAAAIPAAATPIRRLAGVRGLGNCWRQGS